MSLIYNIISAFKYEIVEIAKSSTYRTTLLGLPLVTIIFFGTMFYGGTIEDLPIIVTDNDHTTSSNQLLSMISATRGVEIVDYASSMLEAEEILRRGDAYALLLIPEGLERNIYGSKPTNIECYISGTNLSASGIIEREIESCTRSFAAGIEIEKLKAQGVNQHKVMQEVMPINILVHTISNPYINYGYYLAPIFMFMALAIFTTLTTTYAFGRELYYATAPKWLALAENNIVAATIGKLLPTTVIMVTLSQLIYFVLFILMGMECAGGYLTLTIGSIIFILAYQSVAVFITTITSNMRLALSLGGGYAVMAFTFSGITFPTSAMFEAMRLLSNIFPLRWFSEIFIDQAMRGAPLIYTLKPLLALAIFTLIPLPVIKRLRRISLTPIYWSKD
jgi:ABC-2 type transport system permease protein